MSIAAFGWIAAIEPDLSGKLHFGDKHRITESIFRNFQKKNKFVSPKSVFLEPIGTINAGGLGAPGIGLVVVGGDETLFYDSKSHCGSFDTDMPQ